MGATWINQFGEVGGDSFITWCVAVRDLDKKQIKSGYLRFLDSGEEFIDAIKFRKFCLGKKTMIQIEQYRYKIFQRALPDFEKIKKSKIARKKYIKTIRENLS